MLHHAQANKRLVALDREADFYLCNPDGLRMGRPKRVVEKTEEGKIKRVYYSEPTGLYAALLAKKFDIIIFDEATTYRETGTETFKCALSLSKAASFVYLLTGTPTPNGPLDAYGLKRLCHPTYKLSFKTWRDMTTRADGPFRRVALPEAVALVDELLQPSIRIVQDQCFTPTSMTVLDLQAPLSGEQKTAMRELKTELSIMVDDGEVNAVNEAALRSKLIQISCGAVYDQDHHTRLVAAPERLAMLQSLVAGIPGKIIVFAPLTSVLALLARAIPGSTLIDNSLSKQKKLRLLREWQTSPTSRVLLSHPGPVARGIDLSMANTIIWYAPIDRTEYFIQANERINGINQKLPRYIIRMYGCEIERKIYERLESNQSLQGLILKLKEMKL
jgi:SNF2 family DNA or RNA helicase